MKGDGAVDQQNPEIQALFTKDKNAVLLVKCAESGRNLLV